MDVRIDDSLLRSSRREGAAQQTLHKQSPVHISY
jgi:hypothetical protein